MQYKQQYDSSDCGAACIAMIISHFGKTPNIAEIRQNAGTDTEGINFQGLLNAAKCYNLKARAVKGSSEEFFKWWTGYAVFFEPDVDFVKSDKKENLLLKFIPVFLPHKKLLFYSLFGKN